VVRVRFIADASQVPSELGTGGCDVALDDSLSADNLDALSQIATSGGLKQYHWPGSIRDQIVMNTYTGDGNRIPFLADQRVRQAVAFGFDRAAAVQTAWQGLSPLLDSWIPPEHWASASAGFNGYNLDPGKAASLLDQAGWQDQDGDGVREYHGAGGEYSCQRGKWSIPEKTPLRIALILRQGDARRAVLAQQLQSNLKQIGVDLQLTPMPADVMFRSDGPLQKRDFDMALTSAAIRPDPGGVSQWLGADVFRHPLQKTLVHRWQLEQRWLENEQLVERLAPSNVPGPANDWQGQNYAGWCNEQADTAIVEGNLSFDLSVRKGLYGQQQTLLATEVPVIPLAYRPRLAASKPYVCGIKPVPFEPLTWNASTWTFDPGAVCSS
jgi:peptide/nickel transport system substrate-binding protein